MHGPYRRKVDDYKEGAEVWKKCGLGAGYHPGFSVPYELVNTAGGISAPNPQVVFQHLQRMSQTFPRSPSTKIF